MTTVNIGRSIRICMIRKDKSLDDIEAHLGKSRQWISRVVNEEKTGLKYINELSELFGMKPSAFIAEGE